MIDDIELSYALAVAHLPKLKPERLRWLMSLDSAPSAVWARLRRRRLPTTLSLPDGTVRSWGRAADATSPAGLLERYRQAGVAVLVHGWDGYPARLAEDPEAPAVLFRRGDPAALDCPTVAIVGTRGATGYGRDAARHLGRRLAAEGVAVVSGLASGIDIAAHRGALGGRGAPAIGVAGTGLDVVYPPESREVWKALTPSGLLLSEAPLGSPPSAWRFPERNRIMAGLADVVVVVESPHRGGSLITVDHAARRDVPVMAVPGPITSRASSGSNRLLADGCGVVCDAEDVMVQLGMTPHSLRRPSRSEVVRRPPPDPQDRPILEAVDLTPTPFEKVLARTGRPATELASVLYRLEADGWVRSGPGWWERRAG